VVVNAVVDLLQSGQFRPLRSRADSSAADATSASGASSASSNGSGPVPRRSSFSGQHQQLSRDLGVAMDWVGDMLAAGRVTVQPAFVLQLLQHVTQQARGLAGEAREAREQAFVRMVQNVGVLQEGQPPAPGPAQFSAKVAAWLWLPSYLAFSTCTLHLHLAPNLVPAPTQLRPGCPPARRRRTRRCSWRSRPASTWRPPPSTTCAATTRQRSPATSSTLPPPPPLPTSTARCPAGRPSPPCRRASRRRCAQRCRG
jgi:hypothetical protein